MWAETNIETRPDAGAGYGAGARTAFWGRVPVG